MQNNFDLLNDWKSGRIKSLIGAKFTGNLQDHPEKWVILLSMPTDLGQTENGKPVMTYVWNAFSFIGQTPLHGVMVPGPIWDDNLNNAMPFPTIELAQEFADKVLKDKHPTICKVKNLHKYGYIFNQKTQS